MKLFYILIALAGILLFSCSKTNRSNNDIITGKWELRESSGGFAGTIKYEPGNGNSVLFNSDNTYQFISPNASTIPGGNYTLKKSIASDDWILTLDYLYNGRPQFTKDSVRFSGNQLIFLPSASCCDIPTTFYDRIDLH